jgi:hypothetical protein
MKAWKPAAIAAGAVAVTAFGGTALANHEDWQNPPSGSWASSYVVVPRASAPVVGHVAVAPAYSYYYEPAPRYYYYERAPVQYYYEPAPAVAYYYYDESPFPRSESRD